ncbi:NAD-dependent epimerase/dehydratase family protein [soil metagenome]
MKILVAGGTGHTGERVVRALLSKGYTVRVLSRGGKNDAILGPLLKLGAEHSAGDCTRRWTLWRALEGCDALVSCAHIRHADACVQACKQAGVSRYIQMSSARRFTKFPCETSRAVIDSEAAIEASDLAYTILRPTMIFGGRRDANITRLVAWFRRHRWFPIFGDGKNLVQPVFVEDLVPAFVHAVEHPEITSRKAYDLAGPEPISYEQFIRETAAACGVKNPMLIRIPMSAALIGSRVLPAIITRRGLSAEQIQRMAEDKIADISVAMRDLQFTPRGYAEAIQLKADGKAEA